MNPMLILQLKPAWEQFKGSHPKLLNFIKAASKDSFLDKGSLIENSVSWFLVIRNQLTPVFYLYRSSRNSHCSLLSPCSKRNCSMGQTLLLSLEDFTRGIDSS